MSAPLVEVVIAGNADGFVESVNSAATATDEAVGKLDSAAESLSGSLNATSGVADSLGGSLESMGATADSTAGTLTAAGETMAKSLGGVLPVIEDVDKGFEDMGGSFDSVTEIMRVDTTLMMADIDKLIGNNEKLIDSFKEDGDTIEEVSSKSNEFLSTIGDMLTRLQGKFGLVGEAAAKMGESIKASSEVADESLETVDAAADTTAGSIGIVGKASILAIGVVAVAAVDLGSKYQALTTNIAAWGGISVKAAGQITNAFLDTAGTTIYSGKEIASAYGGVVGQLTAVEGHALDSKEAMQVMSAAMDLAEGSGESLSGATSALASVMQTYKMKVGEATTASDILFSTAKGSGTSLSAVAKSVTQVHTQLGALTPPLGQTGALLVDMVQNGMNGSRALRSLGSSMNSLLKPGENVINDTATLKTAFDALPPSLQKLANEYQNNQVTAAQVTAATSKLGVKTAELWTNYSSASTALDGANTKLKASGDSALFVNGKFVGLGKAISILHDQTEGMTQQQQLAKLTQDGLASSASKLLPIIDAGSKSWNKATSEVNKANAAHEAAEKQAQTLDHQLDVLKVAVEDEATKLGVVLIPIVTEAAKVFAGLADFLIHNKEVILIVGGAILATLVPAFVAWAAAAAPAAAETLLAMAPILAIGAAIGALVYGIIELVKHWGEVWGEIKDIAADAWHFIYDDIIQPLEISFDWVVKEIKAHWQGLLEILIAPFAPVLAIVLAFHDQIIRFFEDIPHWVMDVVNDIVGFFTAMPGEIVGGLGDLVDTIFGGLEDAGSWIDSNVISPVVSFFTALPQRALSAMGAIVSFIFGPLLQAGSWVNSNVIQPVINYIVQFPGNVARGLGNIIGTIFGGLTGTWNWIKNNVYDPVVNGFRGLPGDIANVLSGALGVFGNVGKSIVNSIIGGINSGVINVINAGIHAIDIFGWHPPANLIPNIHPLATGGIVTGPTLALIGEAGPEAVIPLSNLDDSTSPLPSNSSGNNAPITIQLNIDGQKFASAILNPLQSVALRNQKTGGQFTINLQ